MSLTSKDLLSRPDSRLREATVASYIDGGHWRDKRMDSYLADAARAHPDRLAAVSYDVLTGGRRELTYAQYEDEVDQVAAGLADLGVDAGDVVAVMLPNTHEFGQLIFAISRLGAIYSGIPVSYGQREAEFIVERTGASVLCVPDVFRKRDYIDLATQIRSAAPELAHVVVLPTAEGGAAGELPDGFLPWDVVLAGEGDVPTVDWDPGAVCHIGFTSGTTGEPKGVMNTHQTLDAVLKPWVEFMGWETFGPHPVNLIPSPVGHHSGFLWGVLMSAFLEGTAVFMDRWDPGQATRIAEAEGATTMIAAPTFLQDMVDHPDMTPDRARSWRIISIPGAPIPRALVPRASRELDCFICPSWGMTEWGIGVSMAPHLPPEDIPRWDGVPVPGCHVRVVAEDGAIAPAGEEGDLQIAGPGLFVGYYDRPEYTREAIDESGWFATGDRAVGYDGGYIEIRGRTKDIIIRGGENLPVVETENLIYQHPDVVEVALVGLPDDRLGERACAVVVLREGAQVTLDDLCGYLMEQGISKHFLPERLETVEAMPKTMSGKVRKIELRDQLATGGKHPA